MSRKESEQALAERVVAAMMAKDAFSRWPGITVGGVSRHGVQNNDRLFRCNERRSREGE
jgi:hypothetical protein